MPDQHIEHISGMNLDQFYKALGKTALSPATQQRITVKLYTPEVIDNYLFRNLSEDESDLHLITLILTVIISDEVEITDSVPELFGYLQQHFEQMSGLDQAIYWHLRGYLAWKSNRSLYQALSSMNRSRDIFVSLKNSFARFYLPRVYDSFGQISHNMGHLEDALEDFQLANNLRSTDLDAYGKALTFGNLGRTHMDLGNYQEAFEFLSEDLKIMTRDYPAMTRIQTQLLSHLAVCHSEMRDLSMAEKMYLKGLDLANRDRNYLGLIYAKIGLGKIEILRKNLEKALYWKLQANELVETKLSKPVQTELSGMMKHLSGLIAGLGGDFEGARQEYVEADRFFQMATHRSPMEKAEFLLDFSQVSEALNNKSETAGLLDAALTQLDATTATTRRQAVESILKEKFRDQWILHTSRRLSGKESIESLLEKTGEQGFSVERIKVVVMFADIRGFTRISESLDPEELIKYLNAYLSSMIRAVNLHDGYVVQVLGDAVMAVFSLPKNRKDDVNRSAQTALIIWEENQRLNNRYQGRFPRINLGIGLHYGEVVTGLIGSPAKRSYTMIGDVVNTASRIEGLTKILGVPILLTGEVKTFMEESVRYFLMPMGQYVLVGRKEPVSVYVLLGMGDCDPHTNKLQVWVDRSTWAIQAFESRDFVKAASDFKGLYELTGILGFDFLAEQAKHFQLNPPSAEWAGQITLQTK